MDFVDRFRRGDIFFPDAESFLGSDYPRILNKAEGVAGSG